MKNTKMKEIVLITTVVLLILIFMIAPMTITIIAYETNFNRRVETSTDTTSLAFEDFPDLTREAVEFKSNQEQTLRGYVYSLKNLSQTPKALIVFSHGYLGTHTNYLNQIDYFVQAGYLVLGFDNTGCGMSDGKSMLGLAQSPIDLDAALTFVENSSSLKDYKILLYGHSWGGYAVTAVLNYEHNVSGVVSRSGFSNSRDMLVEYGSRLYGDFLTLLSPYAYLYEKCKFGSSVDLNGIKGINYSTCPILLLHSKDDEVISLKNSLLIHKEEYTNSDRIQTILYEDKTHDVVTSYETLAYKKQLQEQLNTLIPEDTQKSDENNQNKELLYKLDSNVMKSILDFYEKIVSE